MKEPLLKAGWHGLMAGAAVAEYMTARSRLRKFLALACAGWHVAAVIDDLKDMRATMTATPKQQRMESVRERVGLPEGFDDRTPERQEAWLEKFIRDAWRDRPKTTPRREA